MLVLSRLISAGRPQCVKLVLNLRSIRKGTLLTIIVGLPFIIAINVLIYFLILIFVLVCFILGLVLLLVTRIFQLIRCGEVYIKLTKFKHVIRASLFYCAVLIGPLSWPFFPVVKYVPVVNQVTLFELPLTKWFVIVSIICGLCIFNGAFYLNAHQLTAMFMHGGNSYIAGQAFSEIIDGLFFWWVTYEVMRRVPSFQQHQLLGLPTRIWIKVSVVVLIVYNIIILFTLYITLLVRFHCQRPLQDSKNDEALSFWQDVKKYQMKFRYLVYTLNGMTMSISFIMSSLLLLLTWVLYFGSHLDMKSAHTRDLWEYGKWTFISLLILSFLWLIKTAVLLAWEAHSVYGTLQNRIISASEQLCFLSIIGSAVHDIFKIQRNFLSEEETKQRNVKGLLLSRIHSLISSNLDHQLKSLIEVREKIEKDLLQIGKLADPSMDDIQQATQYFLKAQKTLMKESYISDILQFFGPITDDREMLEKLQLSCEKKNTNRENSKTVETEITQVEQDDAAQKSTSELRKVIVSKTGQEPLESSSSNSRIETRQNSMSDPKLGDIESAQELAENSSTETRQNHWSSHKLCSSDAWKCFLDKLEGIKSNNESNVAPLSALQTWLERAHSECMNLTNTLSSAKEAADCLDQIISWILMGAVLLMWLLFTKLATTKVLVTIASPLVAATFIFKNNCKRIFEGILFVLVVHPIDVGDLCFIDEKMVEVRSIGVWTTTFTTVDNFGTTQEVLIYSTSELTTKAIINYKTKFDWSDRAEFKLTKLKKINKDKKEKLMDLVKKLLTKEECPFLSNILNLTVSALEDESITLIICLEYKADNIQGWSYSACLRQKDELKGDFHVYMQQVISEFKDKHAKEDTNESQVKIEETTCPKKTPQDMESKSKSLDNEQSLSSKGSISQVKPQESYSVAKEVVESLSIPCLRLHERVSQLPENENIKIDLDMSQFHYLTPQQNTWVSKVDVHEFLSRDMLCITMIHAFMRVLAEDPQNRNTISKFGWMCPEEIRDERCLTNQHAVRDYIERAIKNCIQAENKFILAPYFTSAHWLLLVICPSSYTIYTFDSVRHAEPRTLAIKTILDSEMKRVIQKDIEPTWKSMLCPQQQNGVDCGYYTMKFMFDLINYPCREANDVDTVYAESRKDPFSTTKIDDIRDKFADFFMSNYLK